MGYTYKRKYSVILKYEYKENLIISNSIFNNETGITYTKPINSGYQNSALLYFSIPVKIANWWKINNKISLISSDYKSPLFDDSNSFKSSYGTILFSNSFSLPSDIHINFDLNYTTKSNYLYIKNDAIFTSNFNLSVPIIKEKLNLYFSFNDLFNTQKSTSWKSINSIYSHTKSSSNSRSIYFSLTYDFSSGKEVDDTVIKPIIEDEKKRSGH